MAEMMTIKDTAALWGISERRVNELCKNGRIRGAVKKDNRWRIPVDTEKPLDQRFRQASAMVQWSSPARALPAVRRPSCKKLQLPIGISD